MKLIVTEKPSVAQSIAAVLGTRQRQDGYLEGGGYLVSWCLGHLVEMAAADAYDPAYSKWQMDDLPILPEPWQYVVTPDKKAQFAVLQTLMQRDDVESIVCATDAGREGELIFRLVYEMANCRKPIERLWISSMEESAIEDGFANLRPGAEYDSLYAAALCRSKADWLVGINATRLFSTLYHRTLNVGRVMTPTLALVVERESAIENFKKQKFYTVELDCGFRAVSDRFAQRKDADKLCAACEGQSLTVTAVEQTKKTARPPKLYDLTTLQRDGNRLFGYTAQQVLDYAQVLYEKKLLTYPRTDSNYLTEDMADGVPALAEQSAKLLPFAPPYAITDVGRVVNSSKVSDHHALLPTMQVTEDALASLPAGERNVLTLVMVRLLCAIGKIHQYEDIGGRCKINRDLKIPPIRSYFKKLNLAGTEYIQYIGIALDEPKRLQRLQGTNKISLLQRFGYTEQMAYDLCKEYGLLSPIYRISRRGGCWFCPNQSYGELAHLITDHPELWEELRKLDAEKNVVSHGFKYGKTLEQVEAHIEDQIQKQRRHING